MKMLINVLRTMSNLEEVAGSKYLADKLSELETDIYTGKITTVNEISAHLFSMFRTERDVTLIELAEVMKNAEQKSAV